MPNENKPTLEELKTKEDEAIALASEIEANGVPEEKDEEDPPQDVSSTPALEETTTPVADVLDQDEEPEEEDQKTEEVEPSKELYKKKFSESSREAQKIAAKNRVMNQALIEADDLSDPTEEELAKEFTDWDVMSETERTFAKETVISRNWRQIISQAKNQATKIEKWSESVNQFIDDPETLVNNPELEGKQDEFKDFAIEETNNSVPFKLLISAFLHEDSKKKINHKGKMFENGSGGPNDKPQPKSDKITLEQARQLRENDYGKYKEYLLAGKIESNL